MPETAEDAKLTAKKALPAKKAVVKKAPAKETEDTAPKTRSKKASEKGGE